MASIALGIGALAGGLTQGVLGANAAGKAANQQATAAQNALGFQQQVYADQKANQAPYLAAGTQSLGELMKAIQGGQFGPGSLGAVPNAPGEFNAPTLEDARNSPGYQFAAQQGSKGILQGAAAAGGNLSGGTLKALGQYNSNLADSTYGNVFSRALQGYNANLSDYSAKLSGYQTAQSAQQQQFNQLYAPAALGEGSVVSLNNTGTQAAQNIGGLMTDVGRAQAAGTVGSANAINSAIGGTINSIGSDYYSSQAIKALKGMQVP